jgi:hypothetical protein
MFQATGRYTILRGDGEDQFGDPTGEGHPIATNQIASVIEQNRQVYDAANSRLDTVRQIKGRFKSGTDIKISDQVKNENTGDIYVVAGKHMPSNIVAKPDVVVELTRNV